MPRLPQFVVALFPIGHESVVGHRGTRLFEVGFDAVVYRYFGILTLREVFAVFDDRAAGGDVASRFVLHPFDHRLYLLDFYASAMGDIFWHVVILRSNLVSKRRVQN